MDGTVLLADDDRTIRTVLTQALTRAGCRVHATGSLATLRQWVAEGRGDLVISDVVMPDGNGLEALPEIAASRPGLPVIVISAQNTLMTAVRAQEAEAFDYLPKPFDLPDLMHRAAQALASRRRAVPERREAEAAPELPLIGHAPAMQALYRLVARLLPSDLPVLLCGESGTGKSLLARAFHDLSERRDAPFVVVTGEDISAAARVGGGTLVLEEITDFDAGAQARLTRMLDGFSGARVLATAGPGLEAARAEGRFRDDLFYRLAGAQIDLPPLRDRLEDIPALTAHFLARTGTPARFTPQALTRLAQHRWPGNLRELEHAVARLAATGGAEEIDAEAVAEVLQTGAAGAPAGPTDSLSAAVAQHVRRYFDLHGADLPPPGVYQRVLREVETPLIEIALEATGGNQLRCAEILGINRNTLRKKITDLGIVVTARRKLM
ncbi:MAG: nitrogen regulation protein NR(I) [Rhodobacterales bacterium]|nr:MAG: nitrogen regulation protein NR(I) [Rhodobacterales bacterium]